MKKELCFKKRGDWHKWLAKNSKTQDEIWLIYYKKHTNMPTISYDDAVEEALAFGWIDGMVRSIDEDKYKQRYTPRRKGSVWSEINLKRVRKLIKEGRMTKEGLEMAKDVISGKVTAEPGTFKDVPMPKELKVLFEKNKIASENFSKFPPSVKRIFYNWILGAKKEETRKRRIERTIKAGKDNNKFGYMG